MKMVPLMLTLFRPYGICQYKFCNNEIASPLNYFHENFSQIQNDAESIDGYKMVLHKSM